MQGSASAFQAVRVVVVGGADLDAIEQLVGALPARCRLAIVVACTADRDAAGVLRPGCALPVEEARGELPLEPGRVHVLPRTAGVTVRREPLAVCEVPGPAWALDVLLRSAAEQLGSDAAAILVGPGLDGAAGVEWIKEAGGLTIALAAPAGPEGAPPRDELAAGLVDLVLPIPAIAARLAALDRQPARPIPALERVEDEPEPGPAADALREILARLEARWGHDFTAYRRETLLRRIERRMQICETADLAGYRRYLDGHPGELADLRRDLLIKVTRFFRDPDAFDALSRRVVPALFEGKAPGDQIRIWVVGCATGEEAYSLSILLAEHARQLRDPPRVRIFATDLDDEALARARAGAYPDAIGLDLTPERLERNFVREDPRYLVHEALRDVMLFSQHDVLRNPPFSRLDLISCRNLLIYLDRGARDRVLEAFHFGLRPGGFLFLGPSESADGPARRFEVRDSRHRIYVRRSAPRAAPPPPPRDPSLEAVARELHQLRDRIRSATAQLEGLLEADRRKDEFLATLSHELRHPLTPLRVALDVARHAENDPDQRARSLAIMERQVEQLTRLVDDLFDLSLIVHGKLELERVQLDPVEVVHAALEAMSPLLGERSHRLRLHHPGPRVRVVGDFHRLVQAVTNLLSNAAKYTPDGGQIDLELHADRPRRTLAIRVRDTGIGISRELLASIFEIFVQGPDARRMPHRGLGVGLNLVRRIVELHGGTVSAASAGAGRGSEFVIELPIAAEPEPEAP